MDWLVGAGQSDFISVSAIQFMQWRVTAVHCLPNCVAKINILQVPADVRLMASPARASFAYGTISQPTKLYIGRMNFLNVEFSVRA